MKHVNISRTTQTPSIVLDPNAGTIEIVGVCFPENGFVFFDPVFDWVDAFFEAGNDTLQATFSLTYFNTASSKSVRNLMRHLDNYYNQDKTVRVTWCYEEGDEDMQDLGKSYSTNFTVPITMMVLSE
jgi:hypothetical protein